MIASSLRAFTALLGIASTASALQYWSTPGQIPTSVPARCRSVLVQNITCDVDDLVTPTRFFWGDTVSGAHADAYCATACRNSLKAYQTAVTSSCGHTPYKLHVNATIAQSVQELVDGFVWAQNMLCLKDTTDLCLPALYAGNKTDCSDCALQYGAGMQASPQGRARYPEAEFKSVLSSCSVPASKYPYTFTSGAPTTSVSSTTTSAPTTTPTCAGTTYTVKRGDTCKSISKAQSMSTDRLIDVNYLDYNCTTLVENSVLCIQDKCPLVTIQKNQTCEDLVAGKGFTTVQLKSWNPTLVGPCDNRLTANLDSLEGRHFCIQAPGDNPFPTSVSAPTKSTMHLTSTIFDQWKSATEVPDSLAPTLVTPTRLYDPSYTPPPQNITWNQTLDSIILDRTKYCWINERDWDNGYVVEKYPAACQSLYSTYCFYDPEMPSPTPLSRAPAVCTPNRAAYMDDVFPVATPSPIQDGMTKGCNKFYKVVANDVCDTVASKNNVTLADFYAWNPAVGTQCRSLQLNVWVCVGYDPRLLTKRDLEGMMRAPEPTPAPVFLSYD